MKIRFLWVKFYDFFWNVSQMDRAVQFFYYIFFRLDWVLFDLQAWIIFNKLFAWGGQKLLRILIKRQKHGDPSKNSNYNTIQALEIFYFGHPWKPQYFVCLETWDLIFFNKNKNVNEESFDKFYEFFFWLD